MWRIVYEKQKFASVTRPLGQLGQGEHLRDRWRLKGQRGQQSTFITYKCPLKLTQLWGWASSPFMELFFPFLSPCPLHSRASPFAWLSRVFSRLPPNGELARRLHFTQDRFSPYQRGLEYRFENTTPETSPNNDKLNEMEYAERGCQFKTARAHFLQAMFSPPSPSLKRTWSCWSRRCSLGRSSFMDSVQHWIMNMSKLVGQCWILFNPFTLKTDQKFNKMINFQSVKRWKTYRTMWKYCKRGFLWSNIIYCSRVPQYVAHVWSSLLFSTLVSSAFFIILCHTPIERINKKWTLPYPPNNSGLCARTIIIRLRVVFL